MSNDLCFKRYFFVSDNMWYTVNLQSNIKKVIHARSQGVCVGGGGEKYAAIVPGNPLTHTDVDI